MFIMNTSSSTRHGPCDMTNYTNNHYTMT